MPNGNDFRVHRALSVLERLAAELCLHPGSVRMDTDITNTWVRVQFTTANQSDRRMLVGADGKYLSHLTRLLRMMLDGLDKEVEIGEVQCDSGEREDRLPFSPVALWPREKLLSLLRDTACACLGREQTVVEQRDDLSAHSTSMKVLVREVGERERALGKCLASLFYQIGINNGRKLYADVKGAASSEQFHNKVASLSR